MSGFKKTRRQFLSSTGITLSAAWVASNMPILLAAGETAQANLERVAEFQNISPEQAIELAAFADQIIPPGDTPGAAAIGIVYFMDAAMSTFMAGTQPMIDQGLADWHQKAQRTNPDVERFSQLSTTEQTELLKSEEQTALFGMLQTMVLFGMFSDPSYGGNRNEEGWKLLGFDKKHVWSPPFGYYDAQAMGSSKYSGSAHTSEDTAFEDPALVDHNGEGHV